MNFVQQLALAALGLATAIVQAITGRRRTGVEPTWTPPPPERQDGAVRDEDEERIRKRFGEEEDAPKPPPPSPVSAAEMEAEQPAEPAPVPIAPPAPPPAAKPIAPPRIVDRVLTPLSEAALQDALARGHEKHFGAPPSTERLACAWAHVAHENGRGAQVYCHNLGNITAFGNWSGSYYVIRVPERIKKDPDVWKEVDMRFRAHATPEDGAADYWSVMSSRYSAALALFDGGQAHEAAIELGARGYYTAHAEPYARSMTLLYRHFVATLWGR